MAFRPPPGAQRPGFPPGRPAASPAPYHRPPPPAQPKALVQPKVASHVQAAVAQARLAPGRPQPAAQPKLAQRPPAAAHVAAAIRPAHAQPKLAASAPAKAAAAHLQAALARGPHHASPPRPAPPARRTSAQPKMAAALPAPSSHLTRGIAAAARPGGPTLQMAKKKDDDDDAYVAPWEQPKKKQLRFNFLAATPENVIRATAHQAVHFDAARYNAVFTCRNCGMMLAYESKTGAFVLTKYVYMSKSGKLHSNERALQLDHYPDPWADRLKKHKKDGTSYDDQRADYQDETRLRAICSNCNESHAFEYSDIPDYDSDDSDFEPPRTPKHETTYNTGSWSGYRDATWLSGF